MEQRLAMDPLALLPELLVLIGGVAALLGGSFLPRTKQWVARAVAALALVGAGVATAVPLGAPARMVYGGSFTVDTSTGVARLVVVVSTLLVIALGVDELAGTARESETYALLLLSADGVMVLAGSTDLLLIAVGFLLASVPVYGLVGLSRSRLAAEAAMKTYLLGALFGIVLLLGVTLLYGVAGGTTYDMLFSGLEEAPVAVVAAGAVGVMAGLAFEAGAVPAHFWVPDAAQGGSATAAAYLTTVPKVGALVALYRLVGVLPGSLDWPLLMAVLAVVSMTLGNLAAFSQTDPRRLLGWSTVSQVGYLLVPIAVEGSSTTAQPALLLYLAGYAVTNLGAFAVSAALPGARRLSAFRGLGRGHPALALALTVCLLGLLGTPPTAVFTGKLTVTVAAWDGEMQWLAAAVLLNTLASLYYYLRWIAPLFQGADDVPGQAVEAAVVARPVPWAARTAVVAAVASVALGVLAGVIWPVLQGG